jgi:hypothetical protein
MVGPVLSNIDAVDLTGTTARIVWDSDEPADSWVEYGPVKKNGKIIYISSTTLDPELVLSHSVLLDNLSAGTVYNYQVHSTDGFGNTTSSENKTFESTPSSTPEPSETPTEPEPTPTQPTATPGPGVVMHVGDLDGSSITARNKWNATVTITVHDADETPLEGVTVTGVWSVGGEGTCTTDSVGQCSLTKTSIRGNLSSATFTVTDVELTGNTYDAAANHDPDDDSDGTSITILAP